MPGMTEAVCNSAAPAIREKGERRLRFAFTGGASAAARFAVVAMLLHEESFTGTPQKCGFATRQRDTTARPPCAAKIDAFAEDALAKAQPSSATNADFTVAVALTEKGAPGTVAFGAVTAAPPPKATAAARLISEAKGEGGE